MTALMGVDTRSPQQLAILARLLNPHPKLQLELKLRLATEAEPAQNFKKLTRLATLSATDLWAKVGALASGAHRAAGVENIGIDIGVAGIGDG